MRGPAASRSLSWSFSSAEALHMRDHWVNALLVFMTPQCNKPDYTLKVFLQRMAGVIIHIQMLCINFQLQSSLRLLLHIY